MTCDRHRAVEDLVTTITDAVTARGRAVQPYRNEMEHELVREAAALAARFLSSPTRSFDRPGAVHVVMPGWTGDPVLAELSSASARQALDATRRPPLVADQMQQ